MNYRLALLQSTILPVLLLTPLAAFAMGGMSGGGGNIVANEVVGSPQPVTEVSKIISHAYTHVAPYLELKRRQYRRGDKIASAFASLFSREFDVVATARELPPKIRVAHPCYDQNLTPFDGSARVEGDKRVCISALRIAHKSPLDQIERQAVALMVHEYSEVVGFTDREAIEIQLETLRDFQEPDHLQLELQESAEAPTL